MTRLVEEREKKKKKFRTRNFRRTQEFKFSRKKIEWWGSHSLAVWFEELKAMLNGNLHTTKVNHGK